MRVFVAGATGVIGRSLVPGLLAAGHHVTGMTRSAERAEALRSTGADAVTCDALDARGLASAVAAAAPEVVVHQLTDIPQDLDPRKYEEQMAGNDRLRREGTRHLCAAAAAAGAKRMVAQSLAFVYAPVGDWVKDESARLYLDAPPPMRRTVEAVRDLEAAVTSTQGIDGIVLRYGMLYGPGTALSRGGRFAALIQRGHLPIVGDGAGLASFTHVDDAASACVRAVERGAPGIYNVVDDEPAAARDWIPHVAGILGASRPSHVPALLARVVAGPLAVMLMTQQRGASNTKARAELGWQPRWPSWRTGFKYAFGA